MSNIFQAAYDVIKTLVDKEPKTPMHVGEVMACWTYYTALAEADAYVQAALNSTTDDDLLTSLKDALKICRSQTKRMKDFLMKEGVPLPPVQEERPSSDPNAIPMGVKMSDNEIANGLSLKMASAFLMCASGISASIRNDLGIMWAEFMMEEMTYAASLKTLMRTRSWIKVPPYYNPPGLPIK